MDAAAQVKDESTEQSKSTIFRSDNMNTPDCINSIPKDSPTDDIQQSYETAIDCLIQCSQIIDRLQEQIASKDERIKDMEEKIIDMSLDLASSKASIDVQNMAFRTSSITSEGCCDDLDLSGSGRNLSSSFVDGLEGKVITATTPTPRKTHHFRKLSWSKPSHSRKSSWNLGATNLPRNNDSSEQSVFSSIRSSLTRCSKTSELDESITSGSTRFANIGQLFQRSPSQQDTTQDELGASQKLAARNEVWDIADKSDREDHPLQSYCPTRQKKAHQGRLSTDSIEGVIFAASIEDSYDLVQAIEEGAREAVNYSEQTGTKRQSL